MLAVQRVEAVAPRLVLADPGVAVGTLVANGTAQLGIQQFSELVDLQGITVARTLPPAIQAITVFVGAVCTLSTRPHAARAALAFLASPQAIPAELRHGLQP